MPLETRHTGDAVSSNLRSSLQSLSDIRRTLHQRVDHLGALVDRLRAQALELDRLVREHPPGTPPDPRSRLLSASELLLDQPDPMSANDMQTVARSEEMDLLLRRGLQQAPAAGFAQQRPYSWEVQDPSPLRLSVTADDVNAAQRAKVRGRAERQHQGLPVTNLGSIRRNPAPIIVRSAPANPLCSFHAAHHPTSPNTATATGATLHAPMVPHGYLPDFSAVRSRSPVDELEPLSSRHRRTRQEVSAGAHRSAAAANPLSTGVAPAGRSAPGGGLTISSHYPTNHQLSNEGRDGSILSVDDILQALERNSGQYGGSEPVFGRSAPLPGSATSGEVHSASQGPFSIAAPSTSTDRAIAGIMVPGRPPTLLTTQRVEGTDRMTLTETMRLVSQRRADHESITRAHQEAVNGYRQEATELAEWAVPAYPLDRLTAGAGAPPPSYLGSPHYIESLTARLRERVPSIYPEVHPVSLDVPQSHEVAWRAPVGGSGDPALIMPPFQGGSRDAATMRQLARAVAESSGFTSLSPAPRAGVMVPGYAGPGYADHRPPLWPDEEAGSDFDGDDNDDDEDEEDEEGGEEEEEDEEEAAIMQEETMEEAYQRRMRTAAMFRAASERLRAERLGLLPAVPATTDQVHHVPRAVSTPAAPLESGVLEGRGEAPDGSRAPASGHVAASSSLSGTSVWETAPDSAPVATSSAPSQRPKRERVYISLLDL